MGPPLSFYIKNRQKIEKNRISNADPPKTDFIFLIYTPKNKQKNTLFMYFWLSNTDYSPTCLKYHTKYQNEPRFILS